MFGSMERPPEAMPMPDLGSIEQPPFAAKLHVDREASSADLSIVALRPYEEQTDTLATRREAILADIGFAALNQRFQRLQEQADAPFLRAGAYYYDYMQLFELAAVDLSAAPGQWAAATELAENELRRALLYGFTEAEIAEVAARMLAAGRNAVAEASTRRSRPLADQLMRTLANEVVFTTPAFDLELLEMILAEIEPQAVLDAFSDKWSPPGRFFFFSTPEAPEGAEAELERVFHDASARELEDVISAELPEWPYREWGESGEVSERVFHEDLGIHALRFENGLRLNVKTTDFEAGRVRVALRIGEGQLAHEPKDRALPFFAERAFLEGGLGHYTRNEWGRILAGQTVSLGFSIDPELLRLTGTCSPEDFNTQLELITAYLMDAGWREDGMALAQRRLAPFYRSLATTVDGVLANQVDRYLAGGDLRFGVPELEKVEAVSPKDVREFLEPMLSSGYLELSVVGAIDTEAVIEAVARTLGALPARDESPREFVERRIGPEFPEVTPEIQQFTVESDLPRALSVVAFPTVDRVREIETTRTLNIVASIMRDRLRVAIREALGEAYSPSAYNRPSDVFPGFGVFLATNGTDPGQTDRMTKLIAEVVSGMVDEPITEDEFDRAIRPILSFLDEYLRDNSYWLGQVLLRSQSHPWHLEWARTLRHTYETMTLEQVQSVTEEFLSEQPLQRIGIEPASSSAAATNKSTE
ncbi:MAG: insulinase family protein [Puniceicoccaceae bacterium]|nr:MAG: insulinase family protein [Puniceicoccaceae bacterium]